MRDVAKGAGPLRKASFTIAEVAELLQVPVATLRSWERRYEVVAPARTVGGHRRYGPEAVARLRILRDEIVRGHRPRDVAARLRSTPAVVHEPGAAPLLEKIVDSATMLDGHLARTALDEAATLLGVERAVTQVALPALREIGDRWEVGTCDVGQEHVATNEVRAWIQRLHVLSPPPWRSEPILLACGPTETHSTGLEAFALLLGRRGWDCRVLGAVTPRASLQTAMGRLSPAAVVLACQWTQARRETTDMLRGIRPAALAFYGGAAFDPPGARRELPGTYLGADQTSACRILEEALARRARGRRGAGA